MRKCHFGKIFGLIFKYLYLASFYKLLFMNFLYEIISIESIFFEVLGYPMSYIEFMGTLFGLASVWLAAKANIYTWHTGILNTIAFFAIFYQVQLYADMFLQVFFFCACVYGWFTWKNREEVNAQEISVLKAKEWLLWLLLMGLIIFGLGGFNSQIHLLFPSVFEKPASFPYWDGFTTAASVVAMVLMAQRKVESWIFWIAVDVVAIVLYFIKGIKFISLEYLIFLFMSIGGLVSWWRHYRKNQKLTL